MAIIKVYVRRAAHLYRRLGGVGVGLILPGAAPDGTDLAAAEEAAAQVPAVHGNIGGIDIAVGDVSAAEGIAGLLDGIGGSVLAQTRVVEFFHIALVELRG